MDVIASRHTRILIVALLFSALFYSGCSLLVSFEDNVFCESADDCVADWGDDAICGEDNICMAAPSLLAAPCDQSFGPITDPDAFNIGVILHLSGTGSGFGRPMRDAIILAIEEDFKLSGVNGKQIGLILCDTQGSNEEAMLGAKHLIENAGVEVIIGMNSSQTIDIATQLAIPNEVLLMSPSATASSITYLQDEDFVWRTAPSDAVQGQAMGALVNYVLSDVVQTPVDEQKVLLLVREGDRWAQGLSDEFIERLTQNIISSSQQFSEHNYPGTGTVDDEGFSALLESVASEAIEPDVVVVLGSYEAWDIATTLDDHFTTKQPLFIFGDAARNGEQAERAPDTLKGRLWGTAPQSISDTDYAPYRSFRSKYQRFYGESPDQFQYAANAFDALYTVALAASATGFTGADIALGLSRLSQGESITPNQANAQKAMRILSENGTINYEGASGPINFDSFGDPAPASTVLWCFDDASLPDKQIIFSADGEFFQAQCQR